MARRRKKARRKRRENPRYFGRRGAVRDIKRK